MNVPRLQQAVDQGLLDDKDGELTPIEDMDELEDEPLPIETPHIIPPAPQILKQTPPVRTSIEDMNELEDAVITTEIQPDAPASFHGKQGPPPVTVHAGPVYASRAFPASMVSIWDENYCSDIEDDTVLVPAIVEKSAEKAEKEAQAKFYVSHLLTAVEEGAFDDDEKLTPEKVINELGDTLISTKIQHATPPVFQKPQQIPQPQFDVEEGDSNSTKVIPFIMEEVSEDSFPQDLEFLFREEDAAFTEFAIQDEINNTGALAADVGRQLNSLGSGGQSHEQDNQTEVSDAATDLALVENTILDLRDKDVSPPTKTVCRIDDLGAKSLQPEFQQTDSNSVPSLIHQPYYNSGAGVLGQFCQAQELNNRIYEQIGENIRKEQCMQRPDDPGGILFLNHRKAGMSSLPFC